MIPYYLLTDIFKYLESDEQRQLRLVSNEWNKFLLPFVFKRLSTEMKKGFKKLLRKYSIFVRELHVESLDAGMSDLISACKNTTRLFINLSAISPEAALQLGESFPLLSYLEIYYGDSAKVSYLSPLTRKVQTLYYRPVACDDSEGFMTYYKDFDCPLVTHLIIDEEWVLAGHNFSYIINKFPALKTFDYSYSGYHYDANVDHFVYDVENMVFKEIRFEIQEDPMRAFLRFKDDIPAKTPLLLWKHEVTHDTQFMALRRVYTNKCLEFIHQFTYLDAADLRIRNISEKNFIKLLLSLKEITSLTFDFKCDSEYNNSGYHDFSPKLCMEIFKATTVIMGVDESKLPVILDWLATCFPNLEELSIRVLDFPSNYDETKKTKSKLTFKFWERLVEKCPNLFKIHLSNGVPFRCQIDKNYPHILVDNRCKKGSFEH